MRGFKPANPVANRGHRTTENFKPANAHAPTAGPSAQETLVPKLSGPVKSGRGNPLSSAR